jgi:hypothetical protein
MLDVLLPYHVQQITHPLFFHQQRWSFAATLKAVHSRVFQGNQVRQHHCLSLHFSFKLMILLMMSQSQ